MRNWGLGNLVDITEEIYYTYYQCYDVNGAEVDCLCLNEDNESVTCDGVDSRELIAVATCPPEGKVCDGPFIGIMEDDVSIIPAGADFDFAASFLAATADKTGDIGVDMIVYLNSILGINKVIGYSEYDADGNPKADAINYAENPVYFNYGMEESGVYGYSRGNVFTNRGQVRTQGGGGAPSTYDGNVYVLKSTGGVSWDETPLLINDTIPFDNIGLNTEGFPDGINLATDNILGFSQMADDDLSVIKFSHTYQIPGLR